MDLKKFIRNVPNFPTPGITFRDITPVLSNYKALKQAVDEMIKPFEGKKIDAVLGIESRGFILGSPAALKLKAGFIPVRKKGKLPRAVISKSLVKEYGNDAIEIHKDALKPGMKILIVDDVLATGGTLSSVLEIVKKTKARVCGVTVLVD